MKAREGKAREGLKGEMLLLLLQWYAANDRQTNSHSPKLGSDAHTHIGENNGTFFEIKKDTKHKSFLVRV